MQFSIGSVITEIGDFGSREDVNRPFDPPYIFLFLWFSFPLLRARRRGRILEAYAIPPTPLEVAPDFPWIIRFSECHSQRFQREVRQLNSLSEFFIEV